MNIRAILSPTIFAVWEHTSMPSYSVIDTDGTEATTPYVAEFTIVQSENNFCRTAIEYLVKTEIEFTLNQEGNVEQRVPIDGYLQNSVPQLLRQRNLKCFPLFHLSDHLWQQNMFETLQWTIIGPVWLGDVQSFDPLPQLCRRMTPRSSTSSAYKISL